MSDDTPAIDSGEIMRRANAALQDLFGLPAFRPAQAPIIEAVLRNENMLVVMPTGAGKSLIYQLPALVRRGLTVVVSPLIALMKDQVDQLTARGLGDYVGTVNSSVEWEDQLDLLDRVLTGQVRLLYVSPERFQNKHFMNTLA
ncbi:MAG: DEAD/DEAH box helicase, partial [Planctomycetota bacterium]